MLSISDMLQAQHDENESRKQFSVSERVAIGKALEQRMPERRGRGNRSNKAELKGQRTADIAAKKAGFGNRQSYAEARRVVEKGSDRLVQAMDKKEVSVSKAAKILELPKQEQEREWKLEGT